MNKLKLSWIIAIVLILINLFYLIFSMYHSHSSHEKCDIHQPHDHSLCIMHQKLDLNPDQIIKYDSIKNEYRINTEKDVNNLRILRDDLMEILHKEKIDSLEMNTTIEQIHNYNKLIFNKLVDQYLSIKEILNIEQQNKLCAVYCDIFECNHPEKCQISHKDEITPCSK